MLLGELFMRRFFTVFDRGDGSDGDAKVVCNLWEGYSQEMKVSDTTVSGSLVVICDPFAVISGSLVDN